MHVVHTNLDLPKFPKDIVFLDIETTGLSKTKHSIFCIGMLSFRDSKAQLTQILCDKPEDEALLLIEFLKYIAPYQTIFTYGGSHFDLSFIKERLDLHSLDTRDLFEKKCIDFKKIPLISGLLTATNDTRNTFEKRLGYTRSVLSSGKDIVKTYTLWQANHEVIYEQLLCMHNQEELQSLVYFYDIYKISEAILSRKQYTYVNSCSEINLQFTNNVPFITNLKFAKDDFTLMWEKGCPFVKLQIACPSRSLKRYLLPASDYFFVPEQNQIIHKSIAQFIPASLRRKATKKECYVCKNDHFIRTYSVKGFEEPLWYDEFQNTYIPFDTIQDTPSAVVQKAVDSIITYCIRGFKA